MKARHGVEQDAPCDHGPHSGTRPLAVTGTSAERGSSVEASMCLQVRHFVATRRFRADALHAPMRPRGEAQSSRLDRTGRQSSLGTAVFCSLWTQEGACRQPGKGRGNHRLRCGRCSLLLLSVLQLMGRGPPTPGRTPCLTLSPDSVGLSSASSTDTPRIGVSQCLGARSGRIELTIKEASASAALLTVLFLGVCGFFFNVGHLCELAYYDYK